MNPEIPQGRHRRRQSSGEPLAFDPHSTMGELRRSPTSARRAEVLARKSIENPLNGNLPISDEDDNPRLQWRGVRITQSKSSSEASLVRPLKLSNLLSEDDPNLLSATRQRSRSRTPEPDPALIMQWNRESGRNSPINRSPTPTRLDSPFDDGEDRLVNSWSRPSTADSGFTDDKRRTRADSPTGIRHSDENTHWSRPDSQGLSKSPNANRRRADSTQSLLRSDARILSREVSAPLLRNANQDPQSLTALLSSPMSFPGRGGPSRSMISSSFMII